MPQRAAASALSVKHPAFLRHQHLRRCARDESRYLVFEQRECQRLASVGLGWAGWAPTCTSDCLNSHPPRFQGKKWRAGGTKEARSTSIYSRIWPGLSACAGSAAGQVPIFATVAVSSCSIFTHPFLSSSLLWRGPSPKSCNVFLISIFQVAG